MITYRPFCLVHLPLSTDPVREVMSVRHNVVNEDLASDFVITIAINQYLAHCVRVINVRNDDSDSNLKNSVPQICMYTWLLYKCMSKRHTGSVKRFKFNLFKIIQRLGNIWYFGFTNLKEKFEQIASNPIQLLKILFWRVHKKYNNFRDTQFLLLYENSARYCNAINYNII